MPADILGGLTAFLESQLPIKLWVGEVPRQDDQGVEIDLSTPAFQIRMEPGGVGRDWTFEDAYCDLVPVLVHIWASTLAAVHGQMNAIEGLLAQSANWPLIALGGTQYQGMKILLTGWYEGQVEGARTRASELIYEGWWRAEWGNNGAVATR